MKAKKLIFAIFAMAMMAVAAGSLASCNSDEEYNECIGTNTLAGGMMTRAGENQQTNQTTISDTIYASYIFSFIRDTNNQELITPEDTMLHFDTPICISVKMYSVKGKPVVSMLNYDTYNSMLLIDGVGFEEDIISGRYYLCAYAHDIYMFTYHAQIENRIFL